MILRRFIEHVRDQNWFAVGLDVLVVIVGIFLGMQVTEWNEDRKEQEIERQYLPVTSISWTVLRSGRSRLVNPG